MIATLRFSGLKLAVVFGFMLLLGVSVGAQTNRITRGCGATGRRAIRLKRV